MFVLLKYPLTASLQLQHRRGKDTYKYSNVVEQEHNQKSRKTMCAQTIMSCELNEM